MNHMERIEVRQRMTQRFETLVKERPKRDHLVKTQKSYPSGTTYKETEFAWGPFERDGMLQTINEIRAQNGIEPATMVHVDRADRQAAGHVDYARKFVLYCAEIALGEDQPPP